MAAGKQLLQKGVLFSSAARCYCSESMDSVYDLVVVGAGMVGMALAACVGEGGWAPVNLFIIIKVKLLWCLIRGFCCWSPVIKLLPLPHPHSITVIGSVPCHLEPSSSWKVKSLVLVPSLRLWVSVVGYGVWPGITSVRAKPFKRIHVRKLKFMSIDCFCRWELYLYLLGMGCM